MRCSSLPRIIIPWRLLWKVSSPIDRSDKPLGRKREAGISNSSRRKDSDSIFRRLLIQSFATLDRTENEKSLAKLDETSGRRGIAISAAVAPLLNPTSLRISVDGVGTLKRTAAKEVGRPSISWTGRKSARSTATSAIQLSVHLIEMVSLGIIVPKIFCSTKPRAHRMTAEAMSFEPTALFLFRAGPTNLSCGTFEKTPAPLSHALPTGLNEETHERFDNSSKAFRHKGFFCKMSGNSASSQVMNRSEFEGTQENQFLPRKEWKLVFSSFIN